MKIMSHFRIVWHQKRDHEMATKNNRGHPLGAMIMLSKLNVNLAICFQKQQWNKHYKQIAVPSVSLLCPAVSEQ